MFVTAVDFFIFFWDVAVYYISLSYKFKVQTPATIQLGRPVWNRAKAITCAFSSYFSFITDTNAAGALQPLF